MTPKELREAVAAVFPATIGDQTREMLADAALAVVRETLREPSDEMLSVGSAEGVHQWDTVAAIFRRIIAASPLAEDASDG